MDWISVIGIVAGLCLAGLLYLLLRRGTLRFKDLPRTLGIGGAAFTLVSSAFAGILLVPRSKMGQWLAFSLVLSASIGTAAYFGGRRILNRRRKTGKAD